MPYPKVYPKGVILDKPYPLLIQQDIQDMFYPVLIRPRYPGYALSGAYLETCPVLIRLSSSVAYQPPPQRGRW